MSLGLNTLNTVTKNTDIVKYVIITCYISSDHMIPKEEAEKMTFGTDLERFPFPIEIWSSLHSFPT